MGEIADGSLMGGAINKHGGFPYKNLACQQRQAKLYNHAAQSNTSVPVPNNQLVVTPPQNHEIELSRREIMNLEVNLPYARIAYIFLPSCQAITRIQPTPVFAESGEPHCNEVFSLFKIRISK